MTVASHGGAERGALDGARVLIPRGGGWGERVRAGLSARGAIGVVAPLIASVPPRDIAARDRDFRALAAGEYEWLFLTSAAAVEQLSRAEVRLPASVRVAVVGAATARAAAAAGYEVSFVPVGHASARALVSQWCAGREPRRTGRSLVVRSDLATSVVSDELEVRGFAVDACIGYRTVGVDLEPEIAVDLREGRIDVVLLTSLSVGRELRRQVGVLAPRTLLASIGPGTTRDAERLGFTVAYTARNQSIDALIAELDAQPDALTTTPPDTISPGRMTAGGGTETFR
ncbi:uroporphyrinogen-III synthase [Microbacterium sp. TNHR37B]|uniref:uroporphyrinogen-III synthase n=1 Tax=Microbacterium sp. TNHR37B TaxID=1775956 RepID=UPI0007B2360E|nr:uroporphyrinogen-III synthase [Microbacterium sp. TNHR37B]KZE91422.1 hypothetical protein AVP41_00964 [Microbacterium sp. TNHR37B]